MDVRPGTCSPPSELIFTSNLSLGSELSRSLKTTRVSSFQKTITLCKNSILCGSSCNGWPLIDVHLRDPPCCPQTNEPPHLPRPNRPQHLVVDLHDGDAQVVAPLAAALTRLDEQLPQGALVDPRVGLGTLNKTWRLSLTEHDTYTHSGSPAGHFDLVWVLTILLATTE